VRPGIVYTSSGTARIGLPAGRYTIYAGRGFEYSLDSTEVMLETGETERRRLSIRREVPTADASFRPVFCRKTASQSIDATAVTNKRLERHRFVHLRTYLTHPSKLSGEFAKTFGKLRTA
jgi:hypothetical protein